MDWKRIAWVMVAELIVLVLLFDLYLCCRYKKGVIHWILDKCHFSSEGKHFSCEGCNIRLVTECAGTKKNFDFPKEFRTVTPPPRFLIVNKRSGYEVTRPADSPAPHLSSPFCVAISCDFLRFLSRSAKSSLFLCQNDKHMNI